MPNSISNVLITKLCHDLAGNVGGMVNSIDFLDDPAMQADAKSILSASTIEIMNKLKLHRLTFGNIGVEGGMPESFEEPLQVLHALHPKIKFSCSIDVTSASRRAILAAAQIAVASLIYGGELEISKGKVVGKANKMIIKTYANDLALENVLYKYLNDIATDVKVDSSSQEITVTFSV
jgi:hypothetical protein